MPSPSRHPAPPHAPPAGTTLGPSRTTPGPSGKTLGLVVGLVILGGCASSAPPPAPEDIRLTGVGAWVHAGETLEARVRADTARLDPEGRTAVLDAVRLDLPREGLTLETPRMDVDLAARTARGEDGARVHGEAFRLTGRAFTLDVDAERLALEGPVEGRGEVAR